MNNFENMNTGMKIEDEPLCRVYKIPNIEDEETIAIYLIKQILSDIDLSDAILILQFLKDSKRREWQLRERKEIENSMPATQELMS